MRAIFLACALILATGLARAETPELRIAVLKFGTVNWLVDTIKANGLDRAEGFRLEVVPLAGRSATTIAFQAGDVDLIVSDWVWAMRHRGLGSDYRFFPYSRALGALIAGAGGPETLCDLRGQSVGVVGGPVDKSWLILQALVARDCGFALAEETQALFGAPPLMSRQLTIGGVSAVSIYWHYAARLEAGGAQRVIGVTEAVEALGIKPVPALVGFLWDGARSDAALIAAFRRAVRAAGEMLQSSDAEWDRLRPLMRAKTEAEFVELRQAYRAGIQADWTLADTEASKRLHDVMREVGGAAFRDKSGPFDRGVFPVGDG
ncbi:MAG: ABC transporter substrate-binding protein [Pseudomonadota bacterium]